MPPVAGALTPTLRPQRLPVLVGARERVRSVTIGEPMACHRSGVAVTCSCILADAVRRTSLGAVRGPRRAAMLESTAVASAACRRRSAASLTRHATGAVASVCRLSGEDKPAVFLRAMETLRGRKANLPSTCTPESPAASVVPFLTIRHRACDSSQSHRGLARTMLPSFLGPTR